MTDLILLAIVIAGSTAAIVWTMWQGHNKWQQIMWREISRDLDRHHNDVLRRYGRIQRRLDHHDRTLQYLARRLS